MGDSLGHPDPQAWCVYIQVPNGEAGLFLRGSRQQARQTGAQSDMHAQGNQLGGFEGSLSTANAACHATGVSGATLFILPVQYCR